MGEGRGPQPIVGPGTSSAVAGSTRGAPMAVEATRRLMHGVPSDNDCFFFVCTFLPPTCIRSGGWPRTTTQRASWFRRWTPGEAGALSLYWCAPPTNPVPLVSSVHHLGALRVYRPVHHPHHVVRGWHFPFLLSTGVCSHGVACGVAWCAACGVWRVAHGTWSGVA